MKTNPFAKSVSIISLAVLCLSVKAGATLISVGPFVGTMSETWESFPVFGSTPSYYLEPTTSIMGGNATISNPWMLIYQVNTPFSFGLLLNYAQASDGKKGMGIGVSPSTTIINFLSPVSSFGAYWGAVGNGISVAFSDGSTDSFAYSDPNATGALVWHGWSSDVGISSISYVGENVVIDGLQANGAPAVPDAAGTGLLLALSLGGLAGLRTKREQ